MEKRSTRAAAIWNGKEVARWVHGECGRMTPIERIDYFAFSLLVTHPTSNRPKDIPSCCESKWKTNADIAADAASTAAPTNRLYRRSSVIAYLSANLDFRRCSFIHGWRAGETASFSTRICLHAECAHRCIWPNGWQLCSTVMPATDPKRWKTNIKKDYVSVWHARTFRLLFSPESKMKD